MCRRRKQINIPINYAKNYHRRKLIVPNIWKKIFLYDIYKISPGTQLFIKTNQILIFLTVTLNFETINVFYTIQLAMYFIEILRIRYREINYNKMIILCMHRVSISNFFINLLSGDSKIRWSGGHIFSLHIRRYI